MRAVQPHFTNAFDAREDVINCPNGETHQFRADDAGDEIVSGDRESPVALSLTLQRIAVIERVSVCADAMRCAFRFHPPADKRPPCPCIPRLSHIDKIDFAFARPVSSHCPRRKRCLAFIFRQRFKQIDNLV